MNQIDYIIIRSYVCLEELGLLVKFLMQTEIFYLEQVKEKVEAISESLSGNEGGTGLFLKSLFCKITGDQVGAIQGFMETIRVEQYGEHSQQMALDCLLLV